MSSLLPLTALVETWPREDGDDEVARGRFAEPRAGEVDMLETLGGVTEEATLCCVVMEVMLLAVTGT